MDSRNMQRVRSAFASFSFFSLLKTASYEIWGECDAWSLSLAIYGQYDNLIVHIIVVCVRIGILEACTNEL
jgi:hypothetical protein